MRERERRGGPPEPGARGSAPGALSGINGARAPVIPRTQARRRKQAIGTVLRARHGVVSEPRSGSARPGLRRPFPRRGVDRAARSGHHPSMRIARLVVPLFLLAGCTMNLARVEGPDRNAIPTAWPWESLIYAARAQDGRVFVVDLGWRGAEEALERGLARIGARPADVTDVFLTHSHRDHIAGWTAVRQARFHMMEAEVALFLGQVSHADLPSRVSAAAVGDPGPWSGEVAVRPFSRDTVFAFGADTMRAFVVPGHTAGSTAYLFRDVLLVGDAISRAYHTGYGPAMGIFTADREANRAALASLFERVRPYGVQWVCTAHGKCARPDARFIRKVLR